MQPALSASTRSRLQRILLVLAVIVTALFLLGVFRSGLAWGAPEFHGTTYEPPAPAADFELINHTGGTTSLRQLRGAPVLLFFGYTHCPDVCPLTLSRLQEALSAAGADPAEARVVLVTIDPERDTPEVLAGFLRNFGPGVIGLTGTEDQLRRILSAYGIHAGANHANPEVFGHTSAVFGIDSEGRIRVLLRPDAPREEFQADVATLLKL